MNKRILAALIAAIAFNSAVFGTSDTIRVVRGGKLVQTESPVVSNITVEGNLNIGSPLNSVLVSTPNALVEVRASNDTPATVKIDAGASSDAALKFEDNNTARWALGNDSSDSDSFVLSSGGALGTSNALRATTAGVFVSGTLSSYGNFDVIKADPVAEIKSNTDTPAVLKIDSGTTSDGAIALEKDNVSIWSLGNDSSDSDSFVISSGGTLGSSNALRATTGGVTIPGKLSTNGNIEVTKDTPLISAISSTDTDATVKINSGSTTDAALKLESDGVAKWSLGNDVSDGNSFVISESGTLGTSNRLKVAAGGLVSLPGGLYSNGDFEISKSTPSASINSSDDTIARLNVNSGETSDSIVNFKQNNVDKYVIGYDSSKSQFSIASGGVLGGTDVLNATASGVNIPGNLTVSGVTKLSFRTFEPDDTTPSVATGNVFITSANTGITEITNLTGAVAGQIIVIVGGSDTNATTIADAGNFSLTGAFTANSGDSITLLCTGIDTFVELARADN